MVSSVRPRRRDTRTDRAEVATALTANPRNPQEIIPPAAPEAPAGQTLDATELAQLITSFNEASLRLQETHATLTSEVERLQGELEIANEELRRSRQLAALGEMAAGIAHEVRNPLGSIGLYAKILREDLVSMPDQSDLARKIGDAVRGLDRVVCDVLTFAREDSLEMQRVDLGELLAQAESACGAEMESAGVELAMDAGGLARLQIVGDPTALRQAVVNVIRNARDAVCGDDATCDGGRVDIAAERATRRTPDGGQQHVVCLIVRDNGPGVPADVLDRMFNPFFTTRAAGTGLGLPIVHRIMDAHGGGVRVRNADDGGAIIEMYLPDPDVEFEG